MVTIQELFENNERYRGELEADICMLRDMLEQEMPEPDGALSELGQMLKHLQGCADFVNSEQVDFRLEHAYLRFRQLSFLEWAIKSRPKRQRMILQQLYVEKKSWQELERELHISQMTISRDRNKAFKDLEAEFLSWPDDW